MGQSFGAEFRAAHPEDIGSDGLIRVCVGGGAGFIGSHIAKRLKEEVVNLKIFYISLNDFLKCRGAT